MRALAVASHIDGKGLLAQPLGQDLRRSWFVLDNRSSHDSSSVSSILARPLRHDFSHRGSEFSSLELTPPGRVVNAMRRHLPYLYQSPIARAPDMSEFFTY